MAKKNSARHMIKKAANISGTGLKAGFILAPALDGLATAMQTKDPKAAITRTVLSGTGYNLETNQIDMDWLGKAVVRDVIMYGAGTAVKYGAKHI